MQAFSKQNNGIKYLLTIIDVFSKFVLIIPLHRKTGEEVANAFSRILKERRPSKMWADKGREFYNENVQKLVELYSTENEEKSCVTERFNRTIQDKNFKYFTAKSTRKYIDVLETLVDQYNNTVHSSIKMTPVEASLKKNEDKVFRNLYPDFGGKTPTQKLSFGDNVRITKKKKLFEKGFTPRWTEEVFRISKIVLTIPVTYKIIYLNGEELEESFYKQKLQKTTQDIFLIEQVLKRQGDKSLVKWINL